MWNWKAPGTEDGTNHLHEYNQKRIANLKSYTLKKKKKNTRDIVRFIKKKKKSCLDRDKQDERDTNPDSGEF